MCLISDITLSMLVSLRTEIGKGLYFFNCSGTLKSYKSVLLTNKIELLSNKSFKNPKNSTFFGSIMTILKSASSAFLKANFIPSFSMISLDALIPAVSEIMTGNPSKFKCVSKTSLVVPAISETIEHLF